MNALRDVIGGLFQSPMNRMSFPAYFAYVNTAGKVTARAIMDTQAVILTFLEAQEATNAQHEADFKEVQAILEQLTTAEVATVVIPETALPEVVATEATDALTLAAPVPNTCLVCGKICKSEFGLKGHMTSHKAPQT